MIHLKACTIRKSNKNILKDVTMDVCQGDFIVISGTNGSGKSVLLEAILGLNKSSRRNQTIVYPRHRTCYIPTLPFFTDNEKVQTVIKDLSFFYNTSTDVLYSLLKMLNFDTTISKSSNISTLSSGNQKKLELLPLFLDSNQFFVLDEVTASLDSETMHLVVDRILTLHRQGNTILIVDHQHSVIELFKNNVPTLKEYQCINNQVISIA